MQKHFPSASSLLTALALICTACGPGFTVEGGGEGTQLPPTPPPTPPPGGGGVVQCNNSELHVVGIYDAYNDDTGTNGPASVHIDRAGSIVLFLSSYSTADWTVTVGPDTNLESIIVSGYKTVSVNGPAGVPVQTLSAEQTGSFVGCGYEYPDQDPTSGCETGQFLSAVENLVGQPAISFHGCYAASEFNIGADLTSSSNCAVDMGYHHSSAVLASCATPPAPPSP